MAIISAEDGTELIFESGGGHLLTEDDSSGFGTGTIPSGVRAFMELWFLYGDDEDEI